MQQHPSQSPSCPSTRPPLRKHPRDRSDLQLTAQSPNGSVLLRVPPPFYPSFSFGSAASLCHPPPVHPTHDPTTPRLASACHARYYTRTRPATRGKDQRRRAFFPCGREHALWVPHSVPAVPAPARLDALSGAITGFGDKGCTHAAAAAGEGLQVACVRTEGHGPIKTTRSQATETTGARAPNHGAAPEGGREAKRERGI